MKVLVVHPGPHFSVADVHRGLVSGLRNNGVDVGDFNLHDRLDFYTQAHLKKGRRWVRAFDLDGGAKLAAKGIETVAYEWWPDVIVVVMAAFVHPEIFGVLRKRPHHVVAWFTESPYEDDRQLRVAEHVDTVIVNDPQNLDLFREVNPRSWYLPHSYDPTIHHPGAGVPELACDFAWVGTAFPSRVDLFRRVDFSGVNVKLGGNFQALPRRSKLNRYLINRRSECFDNADGAELYRSAKVGANFYRRETSEQWPSQADGHAVGPREVEMAACALPFLRDPRPEGDALWPSLPTFRTPDEFSDGLRWLLADETRRRALGDEARSAIADRTFDATAARLLRLVESAATQAA